MSGMAMKAKALANASVAFLTNAVYLVPRQVANFHKANPGETVLAASAAKAIQTPEAQEVRRGARWVLSRRRALIATDERLVCGDWSIPTSSIAKAVLLRAPSLFLLDGLVLTIATKDGKHYQFGLPYEPSWEQALPNVQMERGRLGWSVSSIAILFIWIVAMTWLISRAVG